MENLLEDYLDQIQLEIAPAVLYSIYGAYYGGMLALKLKKMYKERQMLDSFCTKYEGPARAKCRKMKKIELLGKEIATFKAALSACPKAKNPEKCKKKTNKQIAKLSNTIAKLKAKTAG